MSLKIFINLINSIQGLIRRNQFRFTPGKMVNLRGKAFRYYGSQAFPEPDCTENMIWLIQSQILRIRLEEVRDH